MAKSKLPDSIVDEYNAGDSTLQIGRRYGVSDEAVRERLHKLGVVMRGSREQFPGKIHPNKGKRRSRYIELPVEGSWDKNEYHRAFYKQRREEGLCTECTAKARPGLARCEECASRTREYWKARRERGLCSDCQEQRVEGSQFCVKHIDIERARGRAKERQVKVEVIGHYGGKCVCCGEDNLIFLNLDHINGDGAAYRKANKTKASGSSFYRHVRKLGYPTDLRVLCFNCNFATWALGQCPHQKSESTCS